MPDASYDRRSPRVLLLDGDGRILLLRCFLDSRNPGRGQCWITPGGGVRDGETLIETAVRELREETGLAIGPDDVGSPVAITSGYADLGRTAGHFRDDYFICRATAHQVDMSGLEDYERNEITGYRWWTVPELAATSEIVYPYGLVALLTDLLAGRFPEQPVRLPWQH